MRRTTKLALLAGAAMALAAPASADSYFFRTKPYVAAAEPKDFAPDSFSFPPMGNAIPGETVRSAAVSLTGHDGVQLSVSGGGYQVCQTDACSEMDGQAVRTAVSEPVQRGTRVRLVATAAAHGSATTVTLTAGETVGSFTVTSRGKDTTPDAFTFAAIGGVEPNVAARSAPVAITGHDGVQLSVSGGGYQICQTAACSEMNGAAVQTAVSAEIPSGTLVRLVSTPTAFSAAKTVTLTAGGTVGTFTATARAADTTPDPVSFAETKNLVAGATATSSVARLTGHDGVAVSVAGATALVRACSDAACAAPTTGWVTTIANVPKDGYVQLSQTVPTGTPRDATLSYGTMTATWRVTPFSGVYSIADMGISDQGLRSALEAKLGNAADWVQCSEVGSGGTGSCVGAKQTLVLMSPNPGQANQHEFGGWAAADLWSRGACNTWVSTTGFYFTTVPERSAYLMNGNGTATAGGAIPTCGQRHFGALYNLIFPGMVFSSASNSVGVGGTSPNYTLTGGGNGETVSHQIRWFARK